MPRTTRHGGRDRDCHCDGGPADGDSVVRRRGSRTTDSLELGGHWVRDRWGASGIGCGVHRFGGGPGGGGPYADLPAFGRSVRLVWHKHRWRCPAASRAVGSFPEVDEQIAPARAALTARAARWATVAVGRDARPVADVAAELGCDWHTANRSVLAWGEALLAADSERVGAVAALGLDETLLGRASRWRTRSWCTSTVDVHRGDLLDTVPGRALRVRLRGSSRNPRRGATASTGGAGPLRRISPHLRSGTAPSPPGRRFVPRHPLGQQQHRRGALTHPERHARGPRPRRRPPVSGAAAADRRPRTPRRRHTPRPARSRRPPRRGAPGVAHQGNPRRPL